MKRLLFETDWLASKPVFYNEKAGLASHNISDVIEYDNLEFHPEGFNNYLDFGYSVFEQTPIRHVKFLRHSSRLMVHDDGSMEVEYLDDPVENWIDTTSHEDDVLHGLETSIRRWEKSVDGEIIIPTSGGYDSRLLNFFIDDKSRIRSFTYGISVTQSDSFEVVYARKLSQILGTQWEQIPIGEFHKYFNEWDSIFGVSTHAHGMYHIEFYRKMLQRVNGNNPFLSGIYGDVWAGNTQYHHLKSASELKKIGYTHGINADMNQSLLKSNFHIRQIFWENNRDKLQNEMYQIVSLIRTKMILISYLLSTPSYFGFKPWSPFILQDIALSMLSIPKNRRENRLWQKHFFKKNNIDLESMNPKIDDYNYLNFYAMHRIPLSPIDENLFCGIVNPDYIRWINKLVTHNTFWWSVSHQIQKIPKLRVLARKPAINKQRWKAYYAYLTLKPIEHLLTFTKQ